MRFITFKNLKAKNFLSFGDSLVSVELKQGVNIIAGVNLDKEDSKNGAGKSAITEILYYALYGTTLREISKDYVQNSITKKRTHVELAFDVNCNNTLDSYVIVRKLNPTKCLLYKNGQDITRSTLAKTNKLIQTIIRSPATVFQNSVIMGINNALPFMALSKVDKRKFIESVLGLEVFTDMLLRVRDDYNINKKDYEIIYSKIETLEEELKFNKNQLENYESEKKAKLNTLKEKKKKHQTEIKQLLTKIENFTKEDIEKKQTEIANYNAAITVLDTQLDPLQKQQYKNNFEIDSEKAQIEKYKQNSTSCPTCNRTFSQEHIKHVEDVINKHKTTIKVLTKQNETAKKEISDITSKKEKLKIAVSKNTNELIDLQQRASEHNTYKVSLAHLQTNVLDIDNEIKTLASEHNNDLKTKVVDLQTKFNSNNSEASRLNDQLNVLETVKFVLSEEGIKSFIVKKILKILNSRMAFYLQKLEANCLCKFNEYFEEEIIDEQGDTKSYFNFSGGERKRIDLACLFAFADIRRLQGDVYFSTIFYDELIDSSLDDKGVQLALKVLKERYNENEESCYIITHRAPDISSNIIVNDVLTVIKQNGISTVKQS